MSNVPNSDKPPAPNAPQSDRPHDPRRETDLQDKAIDFKERAVRFWREHMRGEYLPSLPPPPAGDASPKMTKDIVTKVALELARAKKVPLYTDVARVISQEIHETVEEYDILRTYIKSLAESGAKFDVEPQEQDLQNARAALRARIENSTMIPEHQKWDLLKELSDLTISQDGSLAAVSAEALAEMRRAIVLYVETSADEKKVMHELIALLHQYASTPSPLHAKAFSTTKLLTFGAASIRHIAAAIRAHRDRNKAA